MIFPKKEILYAPMLGTLGGGSLRSFGRGGATHEDGTVVTAGLVGYFDANDTSTHSGSNSTWNSKTGSFSASLSNVTYNSADYGYFTWALGSNSTGITNIQRNNNDFTYMTWARINSNSNRGDEHLLDTFEQGSNEWTALIITNSNSSAPKAQFVIDNNGNKTVVTGTTTIADDTWVHLAGTYKNNNGAIQIFLNGQLETSGTASTGQIDGLTALGIGSTDGYGSPQGRFTGDISVAMTYDERKTAGEILQNYNALKGRYGL
jgi:hypothetical protein